MPPIEVPALPGVLTRSQIVATGEAIARAQEPSGAVPWFPGGHTDPWDHVESAMALLVTGHVAEAERAYGWLRSTQRADGSWPLKVTEGIVDDPAADSNMSAYVAVGVWHHWLVRNDERFLAAYWPVVRGALDFVVALQLPFGGLAWARNALGEAVPEALVAGSASVYHALRCGLAIADLLDEPQPDWELAAGRLQHGLREHEDRFLPKSRFSMDWYYPVLGGALRGAQGRRRLDARWGDFVVPGLGARCVDDNPWVTGAETCELVLTLDALGDRDGALRLLADVQHLRADGGGYWTGYVYADGAIWPEEQSTWTAAAVVLAADALSHTTRGADLFRGAALPSGFPEIALECGCPSADRVAGVPAHSR